MMLIKLYNNEWDKLFKMHSKKCFKKLKHHIILCNLINTGELFFDFWMVKMSNTGSLIKMPVDTKFLLSVI